MMLLHHGVYTVFECRGATCYLNSLLQVMYMTPELRQGLLSVDPTAELGQTLVHEQEKNETQKQSGVIKPDESMLEALMAMGVEEVMAKVALIGIQNAGIAEAFEFIDTAGEGLQQQINKYQEEQKHKKKIKKPRYIPLELQRLFSELLLIDQHSVSTQGK